MATNIESRGSGDRGVQLAQYVADLAARLRGVCGHLPDQEFARLVFDIARMRLRLEVLEDLPGGLSPLRSHSAGASLMAEPPGK